MRYINRCTGRRFSCTLPHMGFNDLLAQLREPGEDGPPPSIYDDLTTEYTAVVEGSQAKLTELQTQIQTYESEVSRLKSKNYDLLMASAGDQGGDTESEKPKDNGPDGTDSLFQ